MPRNKGDVIQPASVAERLDPSATVKQLQEKVRQARAQLISPTPENLDECRRRVDEAVNQLRDLQTALPSGELRPRLIAARAAWRTTRRDRPAEHSAGWRSGIPHGMGPAGGIHGRGIHRRRHARTD